MTTQQKASIVAIDDNPRNLDVLKKHLKLGGFHAVTFSDPEEALQQVLWFPPDAIIIDIYMPTMSGIDFIKRLHDHSDQDCPPCLVLSGAGDEEVITRSFQAGAVDYLRKPYVQGELFAKLKRILSDASGQATVPSTTQAPATIGDYEILSEIGRGGMGVVYEARKKGQSQRLALKAIWSQKQDPDLLLRFRREIDLLGHMRHENLVRIHDAGRQDNIYFYLMDRISGPSLDELRASRSRIAPSIVAWVLLGMSRALAYLHAHKIVHRDLKPSNILIGSDQQVYLVDFGLAKCFVDSQLTRRSELVGTPGYLAPELIQGATIDGRCDLFSLGMVSLELLLGEATVKGDNPYTVMLNLTEGRFLRASEHGEIPRQLARIIDRLLEVDPDQRTQSAAALEEELASCQQLIDLAPSKLS